MLLKKSFGANTNKNKIHFFTQKRKKYDFLTKEFTRIIEGGAGFGEDDRGCYLFHKTWPLFVLGM